jgi:anti-sigma B factor antagonist
MPLSLQTRRVGEVVIVACRGTIVGGPEADQLQSAIARLLPLEPNIALNSADVTFLDSAGVGVLVRLLHRARSASGDLKLCCLTRRVSEMLRITRLDGLFDVRAGEDDAIAAFYEHSRSADTRPALGSGILYVDESSDLLAYVGGVLRAAGYRVLPCGNASDAAVLMRVSSPRAVIVGAGLRARLESARGGGASERLAILELPPDLGSRDPHLSGRELLSMIHALVGEADGS